MKIIDDELDYSQVNIILKFPIKQKEREIFRKDDEFSEWEEDIEKNEDKSKYWFTRG